MRNALGALAVIVVVALCAGVPGMYLMRSAIASYRMLESGAQGQLVQCEDYAFSSCSRYEENRG
ncbi:MAG: hypothetical protein GIX01_00085 [Candidatus Eremiobacteraeota bacterium]|nr:hypothetical protein [Candidatus Eremiobacteraeota bacterium]